MGKRSNYDRREADKYYTPRAAVEPLLPHIRRPIRFAEPCAGDGRLIDHLEAVGHTCAYACDIKPERGDIWARNALTLDRGWAEANSISQIITNPPWDREIMHALIMKLSSIRPCWFLFDADWMHNDVRRFLDRCDKIVSVGRVKWIALSDASGMENACWYHFRPDYRGGPRFYNGRG